ncbi:hypothetical protein GMMP13_90021 [Candidatus Magnetomoraceae bacterium gMMP-13]
MVWAKITFCSFETGFSNALENALISATAAVDEPPRALRRGDADFILICTPSALK